MTEGDVAKLYRMKGQVMESTNAGMDVLFATRIADGLEVVIKSRERSKSFKRASDEREWRSTTEMQLRMPKIETMCEFLEVIETKDTYYVIMEKVEGKDLFEQMASEGVRKVAAREILYQILDALNKMHQSGRIHKDLKLENVMVDCSPTAKRTPSARGDAFFPGDASPQAKLIDFDTVQDWEPSSPKSKDVLGTDGYIAPEAYGGEYSPASDIYCVGVIMYKLLTRKFPHRPDLFDDQPGENWVGSPAMKRIQERLRTEKIDFTKSPFNSCPQAADLVSRMLCFDPVERLTAEDAMNHPWFLMSPDELSPRGPRGTSSGQAR